MELGLTLDLFPTQVLAYGSAPIPTLAAVATGHCPFRPNESLRNYCSSGILPPTTAACWGKKTTISCQAFSRGICIKDTTANLTTQATKLAWRTTTDKAWTLPLGQTARPSPTTQVPGARSHHQCLPHRLHGLQSS